MSYDSDDEVVFIKTLDRHGDEIDSSSICTYAKPTPTIDKPQHTIDKYTNANTDLAAITRRDPTIVARIWPIAENYTAMVILDMLIAHYGYQAIMKY